MREVRAMSRAGRRNQILLAFAIQIKHGLGDTMSAYEIARKIDLRPTSPNFRDILNQMVLDGLLIEMDSGENKNGFLGNVKKLYRPAEELKPEKRSVSVRANGKQVGQLDLFS
jgi:hypothetical protein